jgi:hypothetical protein
MFPDLQRFEDNAGITAEKQKQIRPCEFYCKGKNEATIRPTRSPEGCAETTTVEPNICQDCLDILRNK